MCCESWWEEEVSQLEGWWVVAVMELRKDESDSCRQRDSASECRVPSSAISTHKVEGLHSALFHFSSRLRSRLHGLHLHPSTTDDSGAIPRLSQRW